MVRQENRRVAKASHGHRGQQNHEPHRAAHTALIPLRPRDPLRQVVTLGAVVIKNDLPQKIRFSWVLVHDRRNRSEAKKTHILIASDSPA